MATSQESSLWKLLTDSKEQFVIPIYQRTYDWTKKNVMRLLKDLEFFVKRQDEGSKELTAYFVGSFVTKQMQSDDEEEKIVRLAVVDGQQRLTTAILIVTALKNLISEGRLEELRDLQHQMPSFLSAKAGNKWGDKPKLKVERLRDENALKQLVDNYRPLEGKEQETKIGENYQVIRKHLVEDPDRARRIYKALKKTLLIRISLDPGESETSAFETINSAGKKLEPHSLIKSYVFANAHELSEQEAAKLESNYNSKIEEKVGRDELNELFRHFCCLDSPQRRLVKKDSEEIYEQFKDNLGDNPPAGQKDIARQVDQIAYVATLWEKAGKAEESLQKNDPELWVYRSLLAESKRAYFPLFVELQREFNKEQNAEVERTIYKTIARMICFYALGNQGGNSEKAFTRDFPIMVKRFKEKHPGKSTLRTFASYLQQVDKPWVLPTTEQMVAECWSRNLYQSQGKRLKLLLLAYEMYLNDFDHKVALPDKCTIEHVIPQEWAEHWSSQSEDQGVRELKLNTLGNLTLLTRKENAKVSNNSWEKKKEIFSKDAMAMNRKIGANINWSVREIDERTKEIVGALAALFDSAT